MLHPFYTTTLLLVPFQIWVSVGFLSQFNWIATPENDFSARLIAQKRSCGWYAGEVHPTRFGPNRPAAAARELKNLLFGNLWGLLRLIRPPNRLWDKSDLRFEISSLDYLNIHVSKVWVYVHSFLKKDNLPLRDLSASPQVKTAATQINHQIMPTYFFLFSSIRCKAM